MPKRNYRKSSKRRRKFKPNRRRRRNRVFHTARYQASTRPSTYGPGSYRLNVTKLVSGQLNTQVTLNGYYDIIYQNPELGRVKSDFKYFKYRGITVTFYPRNLHAENNETPCYFLVNYDGLPTENLRLQDNVKLVPAFHTRQRIYKFKIPNILSQNGTLNAWLTENELNNFSQVLFQFHAPDNLTSWYFRIDINMVCRGPTNVTEIKEIKLGEIKEEVEDEESVVEEEKKELSQEEKKKGNEINKRDQRVNKEKNNEEVKERKSESKKDVRSKMKGEKQSPHSTGKNESRIIQKQIQMKNIKKKIFRLTEELKNLKNKVKESKLAGLSKIKLGEIAEKQKVNKSENAEPKNEESAIHVSELKDYDELGDWDAYSEDEF